MVRLRINEIEPLHKRMGHSGCLWGWLYATCDLLHHIVGWGWPHHNMTRHDHWLFQSTHPQKGLVRRALTCQQFHSSLPSAEPLMSLPRLSHTTLAGHAIELRARQHPFFPFGKDKFL